jgi:hypothetical protein
MARKSRWQQFSDNFNSVYDTFNKAAQNIETSRIMDDEKFTKEGGLGAGLEGSALERARYKALGDIYTKYGNAEKGLAVRNQLATLDAAERENTINQSIMQELINQRGALKSGLMGAQTNAANASAASSYASARNSDSLVTDRNATRPYRLEGLGLANDGARIGNANSQLAYDLGMATFDSDVETARANAGLASSNAAVGAGTVDSRIDQSAANAALTGAQADNAEINAENAQASQESDQDAAESQNALTIAQATLGINTAEAALKNATAEDLILTQVMSAGYETSAEADAAAIAAIQRSTIPFERRATLISTIQKIGLEALTNEGAMFTQQGLNALGKGLDAGIEWYDGVDDGNTLAIERGDDGTVRVMETRGDAVRELFSASGDTAEQQILAQLATQIQQPSNALAVAASVADLNQSRADTENTQSRTNLIDKQTFTELLTQDSTRARTALVEAQTDQVLQEIEAAKGGLGKSQEIAQRGLAQLQASEAFAILGESDGGRVLQLDAIGDYMQVMRMPGAPPAGVEGSVWLTLSEEEKAAFQ